MNMTRIAIIASLGAATAAAMAGSWIDLFTGNQLGSAWFRSADGLVTLEPQWGRLIASTTGTEGTEYETALIALKRRKLTFDGSWKMTVSVEQLVDSEDLGGSPWIGATWGTLNATDPYSGWNGFWVWPYTVDNVTTANFPGGLEVELSSSPKYRFKGTISATYSASKRRLTTRIGTKTETIQDYVPYEGLGTPVVAADLDVETDAPIYAFDNFSVSGPGVVKPSDEVIPNFAP
jgi:hypothetical protein